MKLEETLTKENFWNELYEKFPKGTQVFCDWIDQYKKAVGWEELFNEGYSKIVIENPGGKVNYIPPTTEAPKFHTIPFEMQVGIWIAFVKSRGPVYWPVDDLSEWSLRDDIWMYIMNVDTEEVKREYIANLTPEQRKKAREDFETDELPF